MQTAKTNMVIRFVVFVLLMSSFVQVSSASPYLFQSSIRDSLQGQQLAGLTRESDLRRRILTENDGFSILWNNWGHSNYLETSYVIRGRLLFSDPVQDFLNSIGREKKQIMALYGLTNQEFNKLTMLSFGVLGNESENFASARYHLKELLQPAVTFAKWAEDFAESVGQTEIQMQANRVCSVVVSRTPVANQSRTAPPRNSRGPTQIKVIPTLIERHYGLQPRHLTDPAMAGIATIGFMAQSYNELKSRRTRCRLTAITDENIFDFIPYVYMGRVRLVDLGEAEPERNIYIQQIKRNMSRLMILERDPRLSN